MIEKESKIGKAFKEKFEDFSETPSPKVWEGVKHSIYKNKFPALKYILVGVFVIIIAFGIEFFLLRKENKSSNTVENINNETSVEASLDDGKSLGFQSPTEFYFFNGSQWGQKDTSLLYPIIAHQIKQDNSKISEPEKLGTNNSASVEPRNQNEVRKENESPSLITEPLAPIKSKTPEEQITTPIKSPEKQQAPEIREIKPDQKSTRPLSNMSAHASQPSDSNSSGDTQNHSFEVWVPSAFTPGEQTNNIFRAYAKNVAAFEMSIYNRNGQLIFQSKDINSGWDGTFRGSPASTGAYVYAIRCTNSQGATTEKRGTINLIR